MAGTKKLPIKISVIILMVIIMLFICLYLVSFTYAAFLRDTRATTPTAVDVIDSIVITKENDTSKVLAEWSASDPDITVYEKFISASAVKLFINWSDRGGTIDLHKGDYFTFVIPDIFNYDFVNNVYDKEIKNDDNEVVATYSIYNNSNGLKEVKVTFTDYVDANTNISGDFWCLLYVGNVATTENGYLEFVINGDVAAQGEITVGPGGTGGLSRPKDSEKYGFCTPVDFADGYYIFEWYVQLNREENINNSGFNTIEDFYFEDIIPQNSPHIFITDAISQQLGIHPNYRRISIGEYTGSDLDSPEDRYQTYLKRYNYVDDDILYDYIEWHTLADGLITAGIDNQNGLNISGMEVTDKLFSANLGTLTRPTIINYYTISTIELSESALGDSQVVKLYKNDFLVSAGKDLSAKLTAYHFGSGGSAQGLHGDYSFAFTKVDENGGALAHAMFSLYTNENCEGGADRFAFSGDSGVVIFEGLPAGTYYLKETSAPDGYLLDGTIYKVIISNTGYAIYYGDGFENELGDYGYRIQNKYPETSATTSTGTTSATGTTSSVATSTTTTTYEGGDNGGEAESTATSTTYSTSTTIIERPIEIPPEIPDENIVYSPDGIPVGYYDLDNVYIPLDRVPIPGMGYPALPFSTGLITLICATAVIIAGKKHGK